MDNSVLIGLIIVILIGILYAGTCKTSSSRLCTVLIVLVAILIICYFQLRSSKREGYVGYNGYAPINYVMGRIDCNRGAADTTDGYQYVDFNKTISPLNNYDGIVLKSQIKSAPLLKSPTIFSPVGDGVILTEDPASKNFPTVDGQPGSPKHLFMFANNQVSWDCCGSSNIMSDGLGGRGCVCYSDEQLKLFQNRGANKHSEMYPGI
jgi:hypothetical protein